MTEPTPDRIVVACPCGAKLRVAATSVGKKAKCPKCGEAFEIAPPVATPPPTPAAPPPPPVEEDGGLLDDFASHEQSAAAAPTGHPCPSCKALMEPGAALCVSCGYDARKGKIQKTALLPDGPPPENKTKLLAKRAGTFALGCALSGVGAVIGAAVWCAIAMFTGYTIGWIAWGVGILAGLGMSLGYRDKTPTAGVVAAGIGLFGIVLGKALVFGFVLYAILVGDTDDPNLRRAHVTYTVASEILEERGVDPEVTTDAEWDAAWMEAEQRVAEMTHEEINQRWEESQRLQEEALAMEETSQEPPPEAGYDDEAGGDSGLGDLLKAFVEGSFSLMDLLFIFLAVSSAYKLASGANQVK